MVITKKVYVQTSKPVTKKSSHFHIAPYFQASYSLDQIELCNLSRSYYDQVNEQTKPRLNYTLGGLLMWRKKNLLFNLDIGYTSYRERFTNQETNSLNKHQVLTATLDAGYSFFKNKGPFEVLVMAGMGYLHTFDYKGNTIDEQDFSNVVTLSEQGTYEDSSWIVNGKVLGAYQLDEKKTLLFGPTYSTNVFSITGDEVPFSKWRHNIGLMVGVGIAL